ncbi:MAG: hypothetical protein GY841_22740, partial [FCB group bacterium]|nr:hypothetical protein [FCB group bacterium]
MRSSQFTFILVALIMFSGVLAEVPQIITYMGQLNNSDGEPLTGDYQITFTVWNDPTASDPGTNRVWTSGEQTVAVAGGLFSYDLGSAVQLPHDVATDTLRWLGIKVGADSEITPRTKLASVFYSYHALRADSVLSIDGATFDEISGGGVIAGFVAGGTIDAGEFILSTGAVNGHVLTSNASGMGTWQAATGGSNGWTDDGDVVRLDNSSDSVGIGTTSPSTKLEIIGDLKVEGKANIGSGNTNSGDYAFVAGLNNTASGEGSFVGGGLYNYARGDYSVVVGGGYSSQSDSNSAGGARSFIGSGFQNIIESTAGNSVITGGGINKIVGATSGYSTIGGGGSNTATGGFSTIAGGRMNVAGSNRAAVGGGEQNAANGIYSIIGGGYQNKIDTGANYSAILGGYKNKIEASGVFSILFGLNSTLTEDSTFMIDLPHIRFGDEVDGYEFPESDGTLGQVMQTDGGGQLSWINPSGASGWIDDGNVIRLNTDTDSIGIGTVTPSAKLEVVDSDGDNALLGDDDAAVTGINKNGHYGQLGNDTVGVFGSCAINNNYGYIGSENHAAYFKDYYGNTAYIGGYGMQVMQVNYTDAMEVNIGGNSFGVWAQTKPTMDFSGALVSPDDDGSGVSGSCYLSGITTGKLGTPDAGVYGQSASEWAGYFDGDVVVESGLVGIGETSPTALLHLGGTPGVDGIKFPDGTLQTTAGDSKWTVADSILYTENYLGISKGGADNFYSGDSAQTIVNLGVACTSLTNYFSTISGGRRNKIDG